MSKTTDWPPIPHAGRLEALEAKVDALENQISAIRGETFQHWRPGWVERDPLTKSKHAGQERQASAEVATRELQPDAVPQPMGRVSTRDRWTDDEDAIVLEVERSHRAPAAMIKRYSEISARPHDEATRAEMLALRRALTAPWLDPESPAAPPQTDASDEIIGAIVDVVRSADALPIARAPSDPAALARAVAEFRQAQPGHLLIVDADEPTAYRTAWLTHDPPLATPAQIEAGRGGDLREAMRRGFELAQEHVEILRDGGLDYEHARQRLEEEIAQRDRAGDAADTRGEP